MALLNNNYIFVQTESVERPYETATHPAEKGMAISDFVKKQPVTVSLSGKIVEVFDPNNRIRVTAENAYKKIKELQDKGSLVKYVGRETISNLQIQDFSVSYSNKNHGGMDFTMTLKEVRIANNAYVAPKTNSKATNSNITQKIAEGKKVWFKGGAVYKNSYASKPASNRGSSTCKVTLINDRKNCLHPYHLVSTDGRHVCGWVDGKNIEVLSASALAAKSGGMQKLDASSKKAIWHTVRNGQTLYYIVEKYHKICNPSETEIMNHERNKNAFGKVGDPRTLRAGKRLLVGMRN